MQTSAQTHRPRAAWLLLAAPALVSTPSFAQDAALVVPPPVRVTVPQASPALPPIVASPPSGVNAPSRTILSPEAQAALAEAQAKRAPRPVPARPAPIRQASRALAGRQAPASVAAAPVSTAATAAPEAVTPAPATAPAAAAAPAPVADTATTTTSTTTAPAKNGVPLWPLALVIGLILAAGAFFLLRGRRASAFNGQYEPEADYYAASEARPTAIDPVPAIVAPAVAAPAFARIDMPAVQAVAEPAVATADEATVSEAEAEEVAALTDGAAPVRDRPWLEFAMRPIRAGTSADEAVVEIELTVANAGSIAAHDVRVSTFMLTDVHASEMERLMVAPPADASVDAVTIAPGEGARIDATLAALKSDVGEEGGFTPVVVADARYRLPDGSEGRTSASFLVGVSREGGTLTPFDLADRVMRDDIEARLHGEPQHA